MKRIITTLSKKWPEYFLEAIVIIASILGAYALDSWNEGRKEKEALASVLKIIEFNLSSDIDDLAHKNGNSTMTIDFLEKLRIDPLNDSLTQDFILKMQLPFIPLANAGYKMAISNNSINAISSADLTSAIVSYYESDYYDIRRYPEYLFDSYQRINDAIVNQINTNGGQKSFPQQIQSLMKDPSFEEFVLSYIRLYKFVLNDMELRMKNASKLRESIKKELNKL